jgi:NitT/TauT family transport system substrate-binding protein
MPEKIAIMVSRHSAFYSPLIATIAGGYLAGEGLEGTYAVLKPGQRSRDLLASGEVEVMQSAVGSSFGPLEAGETDLPLHFAQINTRDGFFLAARPEAPDFRWKDLEGAELVADHGEQPMLMLRYAAKTQGVDWSRVTVIDAGDPEAMAQAFRDGRGDYIHLQGPAPQKLERERVGRVVAAVGDAMPRVAFSSVCATREFLETDKALAFTRAYSEARQWAQTGDPLEIADAEARFFPGIDRNVLAATIARYQSLGCWRGGLRIDPDLFEQAVEVFVSGGAIRRRPAYEEVVAPPPGGIGV